jgi:hypothetical protein
LKKGTDKFLSAENIPQYFKSFFGHNVYLTTWKNQTSWEKLRKTVNMTKTTGPYQQEFQKSTCFAVKWQKSHAGPEISKPFLKFLRFPAGTGIFAQKIGPGTKPETESRKSAPSARTTQNTPLWPWGPD